MTATKRLNKKVLVVEFNPTRGRDDFSTESETIRCIEREIKKRKRKIRRNKKIIKFRQKFLEPHIICSSALGFVMGFAMAISQLLSIHGPTVTIWGTALATIAYLVCGMLFALAFAYLGKQGTMDIIKFLSESSDSYREEIAELEAEKREHLGKAAFAAADAAFGDED